MDNPDQTLTADSGRLPDAARYPKLAALLDAHDAAMREWLCAESISEIEEIEKRINGTAAAIKEERSRGQCSDNAPISAAVSETKPETQNP